MFITVKAWMKPFFLSFSNEALRHLLTMFALVGGFVYIGYLYGKTKSGNRNNYVSLMCPGVSFANAYYIILLAPNLKHFLSFLDTKAVSLQ